MSIKQSPKISSIEFKNLSIRVNSYLKSIGISLTFEGYTDTINNYFSLNDSDLYTISNMMTETNLWSSYMGEAHSYINFEIMNLEHQIDYLNSFTSKYSPNLKVDSQIAKLSNELSILRLFRDYLEHHKNFFTNTWYHCRNMYSKCLNNYIYFLN